MDKLSDLQERNNDPELYKLSYQKQIIRGFTFEIGKYPGQESRIMKLKNVMLFCNEPHHGESLIGQEI